MELKLIKGDGPQTLSAKKRKAREEEELAKLLKEHQVAKATAGRNWPKVCAVWQKKLKERMAEHNKRPFEAVHFLYEEIDATVSFPQSAMLKTYVTAAAVELVAGA